MTNPERSDQRHICTFVVRIVGTDSGTWRGSVEHVQSGARSSFRNCLELVDIMERHAGTPDIVAKEVRSMGYPGLPTGAAWPPSDSSRRAQSGKRRGIDRDHCR